MTSLMGYLVLVAMGWCAIYLWLVVKSQPTPIPHEEVTVGFYWANHDGRTLVVEVRDSGEVLTSTRFLTEHERKELVFLSKTDKPKGWYWK